MLTRGLTQLGGRDDAAATGAVATHGAVAPAPGEAPAATPDARLRTDLAIRPPARHATRTAAWDASWAAAGNALPGWVSAAVDDAALAAVPRSPVPARATQGVQHRRARRDAHRRGADRRGGHGRLPVHEGRREQRRRHRLLVHPVQHLLE